LIYQNIVVIIL